VAALRNELILSGWKMERELREKVRGVKWKYRWYLCLPGEIVLEAFTEFSYSHDNAVRRAHALMQSRQ
jgi:hypothetical protein